ncbi:hypothetical protein IMCC3317_03540 [Kordia antarctica]|uniref:Uncharacterized protein n=1 Tax=Kordia antarctica TaxID=1218801 RepID=A0A7L4ZE13_9FLAO|nr:hypothetical protein [Kordia antarctica]QHI35008.1 hypothetical protein IMCC3317_03540 [Kordia antarctica]
MNKTIKLITLIVGVALIAYGIFTVISPEASVSIGPLNAEVQDNNNAYITIGLGVVVLLVSLIAGKKA